MALLESGKSGQYLHADEYDTAVAQGEGKKEGKKIFWTLHTHLNTHTRTDAFGVTYALACMIVWDVCVWY